jgi:hypothetical protein
MRRASEPQQVHDQEKMVLEDALVRSALRMRKRVYAPTAQHGLAAVVRRSFSAVVLIQGTQQCIHISCISLRKDCIHAMLICEAKTERLWCLGVLHRH